MESEISVHSLQSQPSEYFSFIQTQVETISSSSYPALLQALGDNENKVITLLARTEAIRPTILAATNQKAVNGMNDADFQYSMKRQIFIWFPITFVLILFASIWLLIDMPIQKSSILYANYVSKKVSMN